ncbi:MAG: DUF2318 domain-containing protein [Succinivibrio sp.]|nr:DUF2318 domain-containing protein [Succinivibrio sp.]
MLKYLIEVVQELTLPLLLVAVLCALHRLRGGTFIAVRWALVLAFAAALAVGYLKLNTRVVNQEYLNFATTSLWLMAVLVYLAVLWTEGMLSSRLPYLMSALPAILLPWLVFTLTFYPLPNFLLHPTDFVLADQSIYSNDFLFKSIGYLASLTLVLTLAYALYLVLVRLPYRTVRVLVTVLLLIELSLIVSELYSFLLVRRFVPMNRTLFALIKFSFNNADFFLIAALAVGAAGALRLMILNGAPLGEFANPALRRRQLAIQKRANRLAVLYLTCAVLAVFVLTMVQSYANRGFTLSAAEPFELKGDLIEIPLERINDGHLHRFSYAASDGTEVRFIVIRKNAVAFGVGLDACEICGNTGYYERDGQVICMLCDVVMNINTIGYKGGCNPIPLGYSIEEGNMVIKTVDLEREKKRFK